MVKILKLLILVLQASSYCCVGVGNDAVTQPATQLLPKYTEVHHIVNVLLRVAYDL